MRSLYRYSFYAEQGDTVVDLHANVELPTAALLPRRLCDTSSNAGWTNPSCCIGLRGR
jgi:hypothetical protein